MDDDLAFGGGGGGGDEDDEEDEEGAIRFKPGDSSGVRPLHMIKEEDMRRDVIRRVNGRIARKVVKQTIMTSVYGVTFIGARKQIMGRLEELTISPEEAVEARMFPDLQSAEAAASAGGQSTLPLFSDSPEDEKLLYLASMYVARITLSEVRKEERSTLN